MRWIFTFAEGLLSFLSPCTLPLVPLYITYFASCAQERSQASAAVCFSAGFTLVFVSLGAFSGTFGTLLSRYRIIVQIVGGILFVFYGFTVLRWIRLPMPKIKVRDIAMRSLASAFCFGIIFSLLMTPCAGIYLASALTLAAVSGNLLTGVALLFVYSLGLAVPFILCAVLTNRLSAALSFFRRHADGLRRFCGAAMILMGVLTACGLMNASLFTF